MTDFESFFQILIERIYNNQVGAEQVKGHQNVD